MSAPESGKGDFATIDSDTKLVFSHRIAKCDWITGNMFAEDESERVSGPVQIAPQTIFRFIRFLFGNIVVTKDIPTDTGKPRFSTNLNYRRSGRALKEQRQEGHQGRNQRSDPGDYLNLKSIIPIPDSGP